MPPGETEDRRLRVEAELALARGEERFRLLSEAAFEGVALYADGKIVFANPRFAALFGYSEAELIARSPVELAIPEDRARLAEHIRSGSSNAYVGAALRKDGSTFLAEGRGKTIGWGTETLRVVALREVTELVAAEHRLREERDFARAILDTVGALVIVLDPAGRPVRLNRACEEATGYAVADFGGRPFWELLLVGEEAERARATHGSGADHQAAQEVTWRARDGSSRLISWSSTVVRGEKGEIACVVGTGLDVTERRRAEEALRSSEARLRRVIETAPEAIVIFGPDGRISFSNRMFATLAGWDPAAVVGRSIRELIRDEDSAGYAQRVGGMLARGDVPQPREYTLRTDSLKTMEVVSLPVEFEGQRSILSFAREVSERRRMEAKLRVAERMASVGTLAAGVAHELNNPLAYAQLNLDAMLSRLERGTGTRAELVEALGEAREGIRRAARIVRDLRVYSRPSEEAAAPVDVRSAIDVAQNLARVEILHRATIRLELGEVPPILGDEGRLAQVLVNLLVNAAHAIEERGSGPREIHLSTRTDPAGRVLVEVRDSGAGIAPEHLSRLFDPFFTTKPQGTGTGLGLFLCHGIVESLGGEIQVESRLGEGSVFRLVLPPAAPAPSLLAPPAPRPATSAAPLRQSRILLIDDEPRFCLTLRQLLEPFHEVAVETDGGAAVARIAGGERFDAILCDLMMPRTTGMDVHEALERAAPEQARRMVFLTGGACTERAAQFLRRSSNRRLDKPFSFGQLEAVLREQVGAG